MLKFAVIGRAASKHSTKINILPSKKNKSPGTQGVRVDEKGSLKFVQRIFNRSKGTDPLALKVGVVHNSVAEGYVSVACAVLVVNESDWFRKYRRVLGESPPWRARLT